MSLPGVCGGAGAGAGNGVNSYHTVTAAAYDHSGVETTTPSKPPKPVPAWTHAAQPTLPNPTYIAGSLCHPPFLLSALSSADSSVSVPVRPPDAVPSSPLSVLRTAVGSAAHIVARPSIPALHPCVPCFAVLPPAPAPSSPLALVVTAPASTTALHTPFCDSPASRLCCMLNVLEGAVPWGIVTNGTEWRLYRRDAGAPSTVHTDNVFVRGCGHDARPDDGFVSITLDASSPGPWAALCAVLRDVASPAPSLIPFQMEARTAYVSATRTALFDQSVAASELLAKAMTTGAGPTEPTHEYLVDARLVVLRLVTLLIADPSTAAVLLLSTPTPGCGPGGVPPTTNTNPWTRICAVFAAARFLPTRWQNPSDSSPYHRRLAAASTVVSCVVSLVTQFGPHPVPFSVLRSHDVGHMYEAMLASATSTRLQQSSFYTPAWPARLTVRATLRPLLAGVVSRAGPVSSPGFVSRVVDGVVSLRVLDPAMGAGFFLLEVVDLLYDAARRAVTLHHLVTRPSTPPTPGCSVCPSNHCHLHALHAAILQRVVFGVDLDPLAACVAHCALWLHRPVGCGPSLPSPAHPNLRIGDSMLGIATLDDVCSLRAVKAASSPSSDHTTACLRAGATSPPTSVHHHVVTALADFRVFGDCSASPPDVTVDFLSQWTTGSLAPSTPRATTRSLLMPTEAPFPAFHWPLQFPCTSSSLFDAVVGNPPWKTLPADDPCLAFLCRSGDPLFRWQFKGKRNLYNMFTERAWALLKPGTGRIGFVVQDAFSDTHASTGVRTLLGTRGTVDALLEFPTRNMMFSGVHKGSAVFVASKQPSGAGRPFQYARVVTPQAFDAAKAGTVLTEMRTFNPSDSYRVKPTAGTPGLQAVLDGGGAWLTVGDALVCRQGDFNLTNRNKVAGGVLPVVCTTTTSPPAPAPSPSSTAPFVEGKHVRSLEALPAVSTLRRVNVRFTPPITVPAVPRIVMQEVVDRCAVRKFNASLLPAGMLAAHSCVVVGLNAGAGGGLPTRRLQLGLFLGVLNSKLLEWALRKQDHSDHVPVTKLRGLALPPLLGTASRVLAVDRDWDGLWTAVWGPRVAAVANEWDSVVVPSRLPGQVRQWLSHDVAAGAGVETEAAAVLAVVGSALAVSVVPRSVEAACGRVVMDTCVAVVYGVSEADMRVVDTQLDAMSMQRQAQRRRVAR